jgi:hypothetical protein
VGVWLRVLGDHTAAEKRIQWLPLALTAARAVPDARQVQRWESEFTALTTPPPAPEEKKQAE